jgi:hypothetical protein
LIGPDELVIRVNTKLEPVVITFSATLTYPGSASLSKVRPRTTTTVRSTIANSSKRVYSDKSIPYYVARVASGAG